MFLRFLVFLLLVLVSLPAMAALSIPLTVTLSEAVTVTGAPRVAVDVGGQTRYATYTSGSGSSSLVFTLTPQLGDVDMDGITLVSPIDLNGGTIKDAVGNNATLTFTLPNTSGIKVNYPSLGMDFAADADGRFTLNGTVYNDLSSFLTASGGSFTRASTASYYDSTGTLQLAASGAPRFDYDPVTHVAKGLLIEESRTNTLLRSADFSVGTWSPLNVTKSLSQSAPDGSLTAVKLLETTATGYHYILQNYIVADNQTVTASVYAKAGERQYINLEGKKNDGVTYPAAIFNLQAGTLTWASGSVISTSIMPAGNGWYRCSITYSTGVGGGTGIVFLLLNDTVPTSSYTGIASSGAYFWGAQLEVGAFPTSYIPTTTAAATRARDNLSLPTGGWFNTSSGSVTSEYAIPYLGGAGYPRAVVIDDGTLNNAITLHISDAVDDNKHGSVKAAGVTSFDPYMASVLAANTYTKNALGYALNDAQFATDNILSAQDTSVTIPSVTTFSVGGTSSASPLNGWVKTLKYYPVRVAGTQLKLLTQ